MDPPGSGSGGSVPMMAGAGVLGRMVPQADGSYVFTVVSPAPERQHRAPGAPQNSSPYARASGTAENAPDGGAGPSGRDLFKCEVKGCKKKIATEGVLSEKALITHVLCHHENADAAKRWRGEGWSKVRGQNKVRKKKLGDARDTRDPNSTSVPSTATTASGSRNASDVSARSTPRDSLGTKTKGTKTKTKSKTPPKPKTTPLSPSRLFAKSPQKEPQRFPQSSDDDSSDDDDTSGSSGSDGDDGDGDEHVTDGVEVEEEDEEEENEAEEEEEENKNGREANDDLQADAMEPESAWEYVGKAEGDDAKVKTEPVPVQARWTGTGEDPRSGAKPAATAKREPAEPSSSAVKVEANAVTPTEGPVIETAKLVEAPVVSKSAKAQTPPAKAQTPPAKAQRPPATAQTPPATAQTPTHTEATREPTPVVVTQTDSPTESSDIEETEPPAPAPHPSPLSSPTTRHPFASSSDSDPTTFTPRVLERAKRALLKMTRKDSGPPPPPSCVEPAKRFANANEYAAYHATLVLDDAASAAAESVSTRRDSTQWCVCTAATAQQLRARVDAHTDPDTMTSNLVLTRRGAIGAQTVLLLDELVRLWRGGGGTTDDSVDLLGVVTYVSKDGGSLGVEVLSRELLRQRDEMAPDRPISVSVGYELKTSRREFDAAHAVPPMLIAPLLAPLLTGQPFYKAWNTAPHGVASTAISGERDIPGTTQRAAPLILNVGARPHNYQAVSRAITRWTDSGRFNQAQAAAIRRCVCPGDLTHETVRPCAGIALLHGPPGTGKTSTLVGAISAMLLCVPTPRILVCAPSNAAVDELVFRLARGRMKWLDDLDGDNNDQGMEPGELLRVGDQTIAHAFELDKLVDEWVSNLNKIRDGCVTRDKEKQQIRRTVLANARVVATTTCAAGAEYLKDYKFDVVIIDEAAQSSEAATLIPLTRRAGEVKRIVLAGDHRQLPAVARAGDESSRRAYGTSLFERLVLEGETLIGGGGGDTANDVRRAHPAATLNVQHRMNSEISSFPSQHFYGGVLEDAPGVANASAFGRFDDVPVVSDGFVLRLGKYAFLDFQGEESKPGGVSYVNESEAKVVAATVRAVLRHARSGATVAVITPYKAQRDEIRRLLGNELFRNSRVRCGTVDGYQGQEADVVVFSCVRTTRLGFLADERRLNVAITRARESLLIVGSAALLRKGNTAWSALVVDATRRGKTHKVETAGPGELDGRVAHDRQLRETLAKTIGEADLETQRGLAAKSRSATAPEGTPRGGGGGKRKKRADEDDDEDDEIIEIDDDEEEDEEDEDDDDDDDDDNAPPARPAQPLPARPAAQIRKFPPTVQPRPPLPPPPSPPLRQVRPALAKRRNRTQASGRAVVPPVESPVAARDAEPLRESRRLDEIQRREIQLVHERMDFERERRAFEQHRRSVSAVPGARSGDGGVFSRLGSRGGGGGGGGRTRGDHEYGRPQQESGRQRQEYGRQREHGRPHQEYGGGPQRAEPEYGGRFAPYDRGNDRRGAPPNDGCGAPPNDGCGAPPDDRHGHGGPPNDRRGGYDRIDVDDQRPNRGGGNGGPPRGRGGKGGKGGGNIGR